MTEADELKNGAIIRVIGVGGGGSNAVSTMIQENLEGVDFVCVNTDSQSLEGSEPLCKKIQIGKELTKGLGAGSNPTIGRDAALEDRQELQEALAGSDMVFITAGMGGGTGTGGAAVVAQIAKDAGALTVGVITKPFLFEGRRRRRQAEEGIAAMRESVDTLIVIPNERLLEVATPDLSLVNAFKLADNVLVNAVRGISDIINIPGTINVDFADVKAVMSSTGQALMGIGCARGNNRAIEAANQAISSPLLDDIDIEGASGVLINITANSSLSLVEVNEACSIIQEAAHEDANIIFGTVLNDHIEDEIKVTVIATGFAKSEEKTANYSAKPPLTIEGACRDKLGAMVQNPADEPGQNTVKASQANKDEDFEHDQPLETTDEHKSANSIGRDIDKSIDEALGLIDSSDSLLPSSKDLEVPTYLRNLEPR